MSVRIVWNADSTFDASSADVSINDSPFSAVHVFSQLKFTLRGTEKKRTRESFRFLGRHSTKVLQIALVADKHDNDVRVCVVAQLLQPARNVYVRPVFCDVVNEQCADCATVIPASTQVRIPAENDDRRRGTHAAVIARYRS